MFWMWREMDHRSAQRLKKYQLKARRARQGCPLCLLRLLCSALRRSTPTVLAMAVAACRGYRSWHSAVAPPAPSTQGFTLVDRPPGLPKPTAGATGGAGAPDENAPIAMKFV